MTQAEMNMQISTIRNQWWNHVNGREPLPWHEAPHWPHLLADIVAHGYFAVRLCYCAIDQTWQVETEVEADSPTISEETNHPQHTPGGAVCLAWLRWMAATKGIGVVDGDVQRAIV